MLYKLYSLSLGSSLSLPTTNSDPATWHHSVINIISNAYPNINIYQRLQRQLKTLSTCPDPTTAKFNSFCN